MPFFKKCYIINYKDETDGGGIKMKAMRTIEELMNDVEVADRVLVVRNGEVKADISWIKTNLYQVAEIGDTYFQEVTAKYVSDLLKLWGALKGKIEHKEGLMTIYAR